MMETRHCEARTDLGFTRDRPISMRKSGRPDLRARRSNLDRHRLRREIASSGFALLAMTWGGFPCPT